MKINSYIFSISEFSCSGYFYSIEKKTNIYLVRLQRFSFFLSQQSCFLLIYWTLRYNSRARTSYFISLGKQQTDVWTVWTMNSRTNWKNRVKYFNWSNMSEMHTILWMLQINRLKFEHLEWSQCVNSIEIFSFLSAAHLL